MSTVLQWAATGILLLLAMQANGEQPLSVCDVRGRETEFSGKTIQISGAVRRTDHAAVLFEPSCDKMLLFYYPSELRPPANVELIENEVFRAFSLAFNLIDFGFRELRFQLNATFEGRFIAPERLTDVDKTSDTRPKFVVIRVTSFRFGDEPAPNPTPRQ